MVLTSSDVLFQKLVEGNENAMREIYHSFYASVYYSVNRMITDNSISEDLTQEVFIDLWVKRNQITVVKNFESYLRKMAVNKTLNYLRSKKNMIFHENADQLQDVGSNEFADGESFKELEELVHEAIDNLPPQCRLIFVLSRFEDFTNKMIAEHLGISVKTVENQMTKAIRTLKSVVEIHKR